MNVRQILFLKGDFVLTIEPDATFEEAAAVRAENHIGAIVFTDAAGSMAGILSERDVAVSLPKFGASLGEVKVSEIMTADILSCDTETTVKQVLNITGNNGIRHLLVIEGERLKGVVFLRDVAGNWLGVITGDPVPDFDESPLDPFLFGRNTAACIRLSGETMFGGPKLDALSVLVVDDDKFMRTVVVKLCKGLGLGDFGQAEDVEQALIVLRDRPINLVSTD